MVQQEIVMVILEQQAPQELVLLEKLVGVVENGVRVVVIQTILEMVVLLVPRS